MFETESTAGLARRKGEFDTEGGGAFWTSCLIVDGFDLHASAMTQSKPAAPVTPRTRKVDAKGFVGGRPVVWATQGRHENRLHLLPLPQDRIDGVHVLSNLTTAYDSELEVSDAPVPTSAVGAVEVTFSRCQDQTRAPRIDRLITDFDRLTMPPSHPKWQEVICRRNCQAGSAWSRPATCSAMAGEQPPLLSG